MRWWWTEYGIHLYPDAKNILILCDAGGGNSYRHHVFKHRMLKLSRELGISLIIAHYPPYCSNSSTADAIQLNTNYFVMYIGQ
jgi:hypothetical protein